MLLFNSSLGRVVFLKIWFACAHLKSSGNTPERSDTFLPSQDLLRDDMIIFYHFSSCGWFKRRELSIYLWRVNIYSVWSMICESWMSEADFVFKIIRKRFIQ